MISGLWFYSTAKEGGAEEEEEEDDEAFPKQHLKSYLQQVFVLCFEAECFSWNL